MCNQGIECLDEVYYTEMEKFEQLQDVTERDYHKRNCWVWVYLKILFTVTVKIDYETNISLFAQLLNEWFYRHNLGAIQIFLSNVPFSIQIFP